MGVTQVLGEAINYFCAPSFPILPVDENRIWPLPFFAVGTIYGECGEAGMGGWGEAGVGGAANAGAIAMLGL